MIDEIKSFDEAYRKEILPLLAEFESYRKEELRKYNIKNTVWILVFAILIVPFIICIIAFNKDNSSALVALFIVCPCLLALIFVLAVTYTSCKVTTPKEFKNFIKTHCFQKILPHFGNFKWKHRLIGEELLEKSDLFPYFNNTHVDDYFNGQYKNISFFVEEICLTVKSEKHNIRFFKGIVILFPSNKIVKARTIVSTKGDLTKKNQLLVQMFVALISGIGIFKDGYAHWKWILLIIVLAVVFLIMKTIEKNNEPLDEVLLEDPKFAKRFNVYSSDQVEARYLVTPAFMERMQNLQTAFGTKNVKCSFFEDKIMFAISTDRDLFEIGDLFTPMADPKQIYKFREELLSIYKMIEYFKLNEKTGL